MGAKYIKKSNLVLYATEYWATAGSDTYIFCNEIHSGARAKGESGVGPLGGTTGRSEYYNSYILVLI